jgi:hypothetical protein
MRLTIIPIDGFVAIDSVSKFAPLDLTTCEIPDDIHALQWYDNKGWIEFKDDNDPFTPKPANEMISKLPSWANACVQVWKDYVPPVAEEPVEVTE